ncbi:MAG: esterase [Elusimicrobia bacterium]|nr:esterase [Elusimicrobiota bacterium]
MKGKVIVDRVGSQALKGNFLGDPNVRDLVVYLPPGYGEEKGRRYPTLYYLPGYTGTALAVVGQNPWKENLAERLDRLIEEGDAAPAILVIVDPFTRYGGSQYVDSAGTGNYERYVAGELVPYVDGKFATIRDRSGRALFGKSSGGFGAFWLGARHSELWAHVWSHSGDVGWETAFLREFAPCVNRLEKYGGAFAGFLREFNKTPARKRGELPHDLVMMAGMCSCYSPNPKSPLGFDLPFDERTGEKIDSVWRRWLAFDPLNWAAKRAKAFKSLSTFVFDCGRKDEFFLHLGSRVLARELKRAGVKHRYEEHGFGHMNMNDRYDLSLAELSKAASK